VKLFEEYAGIATFSNLKWLLYLRIQQMKLGL
jgi:hypothetical protein